MANIKETLHNPYIQAALIAGTTGLAETMITTIYNHRELTHQSIVSKPLVRFISRTAMASVGVKPRIWVRPHLIHHHYPDANLTPITEVADYLEYRTNNPATTSPALPTYFNNLDPVARLDVAKIKEIGALVRQKFIGRYEIPQSYTSQEATRIIDDTKPRYYYEPIAKGWQQLIRSQKAPKAVDYNVSGIRSLTPELRDPHSPVLHRQGVWGIFKGDNVWLYKRAANYFENKEKEGANYGKDKYDKYLDNSKFFMVSSYAIGSLIMLAIASKKERKSTHMIVKRTVLGATAMAIAPLILVKGGDITNAAGHGGAYNFIQALYYSLKGQPPLMKEDGSFTSNSKLGSRITFDEVGGQEIHHDRPEKIAYSNKSGFKKFSQAPFGTLLEIMAKHNIFIKPGKQFKQHPNIKYGRPDVKALEVQILEEARIATRKLKDLSST